MTPDYIDYEEMLEIDDSSDFINLLTERTSTFGKLFDLLDEMISWEEINTTISISDSEDGSGAMIKRLFSDKTKAFEILSFMKKLDKITGSSTLQEAIIAKTAMDRVYLGKI